MTAFRDMIPLDIPVVVSMERAVYPGDAWSVAQFKEELAGVPRTRKYIVSINDAGEILGYAGVFSPDNGIESDIQTLTVSPLFRRRGLGRALLRELITWAKDRQSPEIFLEVRKGNEEATPLYISEGFEQISIRRKYYSSGADAVVMRKTLT